MCAGLCFASWMTDSLPRPPVPCHVSLCVIDGHTPCDEDYFSREIGDLFVGAEYSADHFDSGCETMSCFCSFFARLDDAFLLENRRSRDCLLSLR